MLWVLCEYRNQIRDCLISTTVTVFDFRTRSVSQISMAPTVFLFFSFFLFFLYLLFLSFSLLFFYFLFFNLSFFLRVLFLWVSLIYISSLSVCCLLIMILHSFELYFWSYSKAWPMRFSRNSLGFAVKTCIIFEFISRCEHVNVPYIFFFFFIPIITIMYFVYSLMILETSKII